LTRLTVELPLAADRAGHVPLIRQIAGQLRSAITDGRLSAGERLPASRALATSLGVSRTVITGAYAQLDAEGWLEGRHGSGTFVAAVAPGPGATPALAAPGGTELPFPMEFKVTGGGPAGLPVTAGPPVTAGLPVIDLTPGEPWAAGIDPAVWRRAWRQAGSVPPSGLPEPLGVPGLRRALAEHLRRSRGMACQPSQIMITRGVASGLRVIAAALLRPGDKVAVEEPGYPTARAVFGAHGAEVVPCRADEHGLVTEDLPPGARLVYTTPAHQYPLGGRLPVARRQALISWAQAAGALIVEDDYDSEFRYDVAPLPALSGLAPDQVIYLGTTAKTLTPALGVGWLVTSAALVDGIARAAVATGERTCEPAQHALLALLDSGDAGRHIRRMSREYARRRAVVVAALGGLPAPARLLGDTAGLHVVLELPPGLARAAAAGAARRGITVQTLERYFAGPAATGGLVLGYGGTPLSQLTAACAALREIVTGLTASGHGGQ
jgi:GntR family transcriptional regulator/MocR family aminotransferase